MKIISLFLILVNANSILLKLFKLKRPLNLEQNIILKKSNKLYTDVDKFLSENNYYKDKNLITISPAGLKGFYNLGTCVYIKENYDLSNYIYSGVSAGSWNSLVMIYKKDPSKIAYELIKIASKNKNHKTIYDLQIELKNNFLKKYKHSDFILENVFMGVACFKKDRMVSNIYSDFENLNDALDCTIASSHIPFVTGKYINKYYNYVSFDGGITSKKYLNIPPTLRIQQNMWNYHYNDEETFKPEYNNYEELFLKGYNDAKKNKNYLKDILVK
jgi:hypothetical protein